MKAMFLPMTAIEPVSMLEALRILGSPFEKALAEALAWLREADAV